MARCLLVCSHDSPEVSQLRHLFSPWSSKPRTDPFEAGFLSLLGPDAGWRLALILRLRPGSSQMRTSRPRWKTWHRHVGSRSSVRRSRGRCRPRDEGSRAATSLAMQRFGAARCRSCEHFSSGHSGAADGSARDGLRAGAGAGTGCRGRCRDGQGRGVTQACVLRRFFLGVRYLKVSQLRHLAASHGLVASCRWPRRCSSRLRLLRARRGGGPVGRGSARQRYRRCNGPVLSSVAAATSRFHLLAVHSRSS